MHVSWVAYISCNDVLSFLWKLFWFCDLGLNHSIFFALCFCCVQEGGMLVDVYILSEYSRLIVYAINTVDFE